MTQVFTMPDVSPVQSFTAFFEALSESSILIQNDAPKYTILAASPAYITMIGIAKDNLVGKGMFEAFPSNPIDPTDTGSNDVRASFEMVSLHKKPHQLPVQRYDVAGTDGNLIERYWRVINKPVFAPDGEVAFILHTADDITEQIKAGAKEQEHQELVKAYRLIEESQAALQESEARYRNLFEFMVQGYCTIELIYNEGGRCIDYRYLEVNAAFEKQSGVINAVGKTVREAIPGIDSHWFDLYGNVAKTGIPNRFIQEAKAINKWYEIHAVRVGGHGSKKVGVFFTDVTERIKTEEALKLSESNLRNTILQAPVAICIFRGPQFVVEIANDKMYELMGRGKEEVLGKSVFEGLPEVSKQGYEELLTGVYTTGERFTANGTPVTLPRKGVIETVYINLLYEAFREPDGTISGVIAVASDVSEQVLARQRIEAANKEFQFITDFMPQMIWVTKPDGYHYYYNKQWYDYTGLTYGETEGEGWNNVFHPDDRQHAWKLWRHSLETGEPYEIEYRCRRFDGVYRWVLGRALPMRDESGAIIKWFGTCTDIHDQKMEAELLEDKVRERTQDLQRSNKNLEEFAYAASHDLKEPVRKIHVFSERLKDSLGEKLSEAERQYFNRMELASTRMNTLIDDLLMYSEVSQTAILNEEVDLNLIINYVLSDLDLEIEEKKALVKVDKLFTVTGHRRQLQQAFQNLIGNALKYCKPDVAPVINITCAKVNGADAGLQLTPERKSKNYCQVTVKDNGIGFEQEDADRIFNVFTRLHGMTEYKGTGVGLSIVRKVIENHKGYISAESKPGEGATFKLLLPAN